LDKKTIKEDKLYNGTSIGRLNGFVVQRSDGKVKVTMNATEGISIESDVGEGLTRCLFIDTHGNLTLASGVIQWDNFSGTPNFVSPEDLAQTLTGYTDNEALALELANYITEGTLSESLASYVTSQGLTTILGKDYVITGKILANYISGGTLTGVTINITDDARVGDVLTVGSGSSYIKLKNVGGNAYLNCNGSDLVRLWDDGLYVYGDICVTPGMGFGISNSLGYDSYTRLITFVSQNQIDFFGYNSGAAVNIYGNIRLATSGGKLAFFGSTPQYKQAVADIGSLSTSQSAGSSYTSNEQTMINNLKSDVTTLKNKLNALLDALQSYNLV
jgi:hypothetical protein